MVWRSARHCSARQFPFQAKEERLFRQLAVQAQFPPLEISPLYAHEAFEPLLIYPHPTKWLLHGKFRARGAFCEGLKGKSSCCRSVHTSFEGFYSRFHGLFEPRGKKIAESCSVKPPKIALFSLRTRQALQITPHRADLIAETEE